MSKLSDLQAAYEATTKADWMHSDMLSAVVCIEAHDIRLLADFGKIDNHEPTAEFIVLAHNLMPDLIEAVKLLGDSLKSSVESNSELWHDNRRKARAIQEKFK